MNLGEVLERLYHRLGDVKANPKTFTRARLLELVNEGCLVFREQVEDEWYRADQDVTAAQAVYSFISDHIRAVRVAYDDRPLTPSTVQELQSLDDLWQTRSAPTPRRWTSQGQAHDEFRLYPVPSVSTADTYAFTQGNGIVTRMVDPDGDAYTFNQATGIVTYIDDMNVDPATGVVVNQVPQGASQLTIWGVLRPRTLVGDEEDVPLKIGFHVAPIYYTCWQIYEEDGVNHNKILAGYYRQLFLGLVEEARTLRDDPLPFEKHVLRGAAAELYEEITGRPPSPWPSTADLGSGPISIGWTRKNYW